MARSGSLKRGIGDLKRGLERAASAARQAADAPDSGRNVNVAGRSNVVAANLGEDESVRRASAVQSVRIRQDGGQKYEESETSRSFRQGDQHLS